MEVVSRSWGIAKLSFGTVRQDKEMLAFPLLAGVFSLLYSAALLFPTIIVGFMNQPAGGTLTWGITQYAVLGLTYLGLAFIATFFNTCVVYTSKVRFEGGDATFMESLRFAISRARLIFAWSMVAATVGILLHAIDRAARRMGGVGEMVVNMIRSMLGMVWSIVTLFVVPAMVYHDLGPVDAIKKSTETIRATWGESLIRHYGMGLIQALFFFLGLGLTAGLLVVLAGLLDTTGTIIAVAFGAVYFLGLVLVFNCANTVFNTALYAFAQDGKAPQGFDTELLQGTFTRTG